MENFKSKKIKVYDLFIEVEIDRTQSNEYAEKIKKLTYEYKNCFLEEQKEKLFDKLLAYSALMNKKEIVELNLYTEAYDQTVFFNGKVTNLNVAKDIENFMKLDPLEKITITKEDILLKIDGLGVFKAKNNLKIEEGTYNLKVINSRIEEKESNLTGLAIIGDSRRRIVEHLLDSIKDEGKLFYTELYKSLLRRPENPINDFYYKGVNRLRLCYVAAQKGYKDSRWITFKQARENKLKIKKGEKGTICEKWEFNKKIKEKDKNGKIIEYEEKLSKPYSSYFTLFNAEQIEGMPPQKEKDKKSLDEILEQLKANSICPLVQTNREKIEYNDKFDTLFIPENTFLNKESYAETLIHEMCHATGSENKLKRHKTLNSIGEEELITEIATIFVKSNLGLDFEADHMEGHNTFINHFEKILETNYHNFFRMCTEADKAAEMIYESYKGINEKKKEIEKNNNLFENLTVILDSSDYNFNLESKTKLTGIEAYKFLKKVISLDNRCKEKYKTTIFVGYKDKLHKFNLILGNCEFNMSNTVSEALEYRLNLYKEKMQNYINKTGKTEFLVKFNNQLKIDGNLKENIKVDEKEYLSYQRNITQQKVENKKKEEKRSLRLRNSRSRSR